MKSTLLFLFLVTILTSCNGQNSSVSDHSDAGKLLSADTVAELSKNIMIVYQDKKNNYWFGSWEDGLYKYDGKTILHFTTKNGLLHNRIDEIKEDKYGNLYFNTSGGVSKFDGAKFTGLTVSDISKSEWKLEADDLWFRCMQEPGNVYRYDGNMLHQLAIPHTKLGDEYNASNPVGPNRYDVYTIYKDSRGNSWFGTAAFGALRYNGKSFDWILETDVTEIHNGPSNGVRSIIEDKSGYFWFNSMYRYTIYGKREKDLPDSTFYSREKSIGSLDGKKDGNLNEYLSIVKDNNNELWIATYANGIYRIKGRKIIHYPVQNDSKNINVFAVYKDNKGGLWLGTHENGVYKFNGKTFEKFKP